MTLTSRASPFVGNYFEQLFRARPGPPPPGATYKTPALTATVLAVEPEGARTVRFVFNEALDSPAYRFLAWQDGRLARIVPPPVGETIELPEVPALTRFTP